MQPFYIVGYDQGGLVTDRKPFLLIDQSFSTLENAYCWRQRVKKREALELLGRLRRKFTSVSFGNTIGGQLVYGFNLVITVPIPEANFSLEPGSIQIVVGAPDNATFQDNGDGTFTTTGKGDAANSSINYATGIVLMALTAPVIGGAPVVMHLNYFPNLPVMGIWQQEIDNTNNERTIIFDTTYAYQFIGNGFEELIPGTTWSGTDADFFWATNYRGSTPQSRLFFTTNFVNNAANPIRFTDTILSGWTNFTPLISATDRLYQAKILIPYFGRLIALNTFEGTDAGGFGGAVNIFNRARFSQLGDPTNQGSLGPYVPGSWAQDVFGRGGFIDAPTNEAIISATFFKNTLIVGFERSTWQLRYVGEYGLPFLWERISSDFGTESQFSSVLFDQGVVSVGDRAITSASDTTVTRIDNQIPDTVFEFRNAEDGLARVHGVRDFQRELVFWCYSDSFFQRKFPNRTLLFNYRNNTYAIFRNNITTFGIFQPQEDISWDSLTTFWDDDEVFWGEADQQSQFERIISGNQQGYIHYYGYVDLDEPSLNISNIDLTVDPFVFTVIDHNLEDGESVYLTGALFFDGGAPVSTNLNNQIYSVVRIDANTFSLAKWVTSVNPHQYANLNYTNFPTTTPPITATYIGGGQFTLLPLLRVVTKDFNPYQTSANQSKLIYLDFLMDTTENGAMTIKLFVNTSLVFQANLTFGNPESETFLTPPFYVPGSKYTWHRCYTAASGNFIRIELTLDDDLINDINIQESDWILNAMTLYFRQAGRSIF